MAQTARNLTDAETGPLRGFWYLIVDRDPLYAEHFKAPLSSAGVKLLRLPARSPNLNAFAERFVRAIKQECLRHIVPLGERHLRRVVGEFVAHYHSERNHQGLGNVIPFPSPSSLEVRDPICRRVRWWIAQLPSPKGRVNAPAEYRDTTGLAATGNVHILRHTFCSHLAMRGAPPKAIQDLAGHQHLSTTMRYMHLSPSERERADDGGRHGASHGTRAAHGRAASGST